MHAALFEASPVRFWDRDLGPDQLHLLVADLAGGPGDAGPDEAGLRDLTVEGVDFRLVGGQDRGLREGNAHFALTADFVSEDAYKVYDADPEHNRIRRELFAPIAASIDRIQFALPD